MRLMITLEVEKGARMGDKKSFVLGSDSRRYKRSHNLSLSFLLIYYYLIRELYIFNSFHFKILRKAKRYVRGAVFRSHSKGFKYLFLSQIL